MCAEVPRVASVIRSKSAPDRTIDLGLLVLDADAPVNPYPMKLRGCLLKVRIVGFGCTDSECAQNRGGGRISSRRFAATTGEFATVGTLLASVVDLATKMIIDRSEAGDTCAGDSGGAVLERAGEEWRVRGDQRRGPWRTLCFRAVMAASTRA